MSVPHALRDQAGLSLVEVNGLLFWPLGVGPQEDVHCTLQEVQQLVLFGMHFPFVPNTWRLHGKDANVTSVELDRQELNGWLSPPHLR